MPELLTRSVLQNFPAYDIFNYKGWTMLVRTQFPSFAIGRPYNVREENMNITTEELDSLIDKANIQKHLLDLCSDNQNSVYRALQSLVGFYKMRKRKDCLIAIIGFVYYKIKNSNDVENILGHVKFLENYEVSAHLLKIISQDKEIHKKRLFITAFLRYIRLNLHNTYTKIETEEIKKIILDSNWGTKSNTKFLNLFHDDYDNF